MRGLLRRLVVGIGRRTFDPDVAALEVLVLPDRRDLLDALDRVAARGKRVRAMRRRRRDHDAGLADLEAAGAMVDGQRASTATALRLPSAIRSNAFTASGRIRFVVQPQHAPPGIVIAHQPDERRDRAALAATSPTRRRLGVQRVRVTRTVHRVDPELIRA